MENDVGLPFLEGLFQAASVAYIADEETELVLGGILVFKFKLYVMERGFGIVHKKKFLYFKSADQTAQFAADAACGSCYHYALVLEEGVDVVHVHHYLLPSEKVLYLHLADRSLELAVVIYLRSIVNHKKFEMVFQGERYQVVSLRFCRFFRREHYGVYVLLFYHVPEVFEVINVINLLAEDLVMG